MVTRRAPGKSRVVVTGEADRADGRAQGGASAALSVPAGPARGLPRMQALGPMQGDTDGCGGQGPPKMALSGQPRRQRHTTRAPSGSRGSVSVWALLSLGKGWELFISIDFFLMCVSLCDSCSVSSSVGLH